MWRIRNGSSIVLKDTYYSSVFESYVYLFVSVVPEQGVLP